MLRGKQFGLSSKSETELPYDPAISLLGGYTKEELKIGTQTRTNTQMFIAALLAIAKKWKQTNFPSTD